MGRDWSYDREGDHEAAGKERWLITYADLVTLLMVFFVVLYALAPKGVNENFEKLKASLSTSLKKTTNPKVGEKDAYTATGVKENKKLQATADSVVESIVTNDPKGNREYVVEDHVAADVTEFVKVFAADAARQAYAPANPASVISPVNARAQILAVMASARMLVFTPKSTEAMTGKASSQGKPAAMKPKFHRKYVPSNSGSAVTTPARTS